ncbi:MAG: hypothetical protein ACJA0X_000089 [Cyclobacteriaceae bacterium]|jgi:hypothetical protein
MMSVTYQKEDTKINDFTLLELEATYPYADYLNWSFEERVALIKGKVFKMFPAPREIHEEISTIISNEIYNFLKNQPCKGVFYTL